MATATERGFTLKDLPMVIDPASEFVEVKLTDRSASGASDETIRHVAYRRVEIPWDFLPLTKSLDFANIFMDTGDWRQSRRGLAYDVGGVLRAILYRDPSRPDDWSLDEMPEEFTGKHSPMPSVRFMFEDHDIASSVCVLAAKLQVAIRTGMHYEGMQDDAQELVNLIIGRGSEPRFVAVHDPLQSQQF
jgi:hypothetical protein